VDQDLTNQLITELRLGFGNLSGKFDQTKAELGLALDQTKAELGLALDRTTAELRLGLGNLSDKLDQTNARLDETILRLDRTNMSVELLRAETNEKLDGVGSYLKSINGHIMDHSEEIADLKGRVKNLEEPKS